MKAKVPTDPVTFELIEPHRLITDTFNLANQHFDAEMLLEMTRR